MPTPDAGATYRFGDFVLDVSAWELRRNGRVVRLERRPMQLLILLLERSGRLVPRPEIVERLWGTDVFVDVETSVNTAVRKIRLALGDSAESPRFVETVSGLGYRFIGELIPDTPPTQAPLPAAPVPVEEARPSSRSAGVFMTAGLILAAAIIGTVAFVALRDDPRPPIRIAVLPFENLNRDPAHDYLAAGLMDDTIVWLGQLDPEQVHAIARSSMLFYRGVQKRASEIGAELGVDYIVESAIRVEGSTVRVTSKLIRVTDQAQIWSKSYDREMTGVLDLQRELSSDIAQGIRLRLAPGRQDALVRRQTQRADAYDLYLRGRNFEDQRTPASTRQALQLYRDAVALDPNYALAWAAIAMTSAARPINSDGRPRDEVPSARDAAARAVAADPQLAEAQFSQAYVNWCCDWNWAEAEAGLRRASSLNPQFARAHLTLGHALSQQGKHAEASRSTLRARDIDPLNPMACALSSQVAFQARDLANAVSLADRAIALNPQFWIGYMVRAQALVQLRRYDEATEAVASAIRLSGQNSKPISLHGYLLAVTGRVTDAREVLDALTVAAQVRYIPPYALALVHLGLGEHDRAFQYLEAAYEERDVHLIFLPVDEKWDPVRQDPRFVSLIERCGFDGANKRAG